MAKNTKPRKIYRPRPVNVPITRGMLNTLGQEMHFALMGMECGDNSSTNWKNVGKVLFIVSMASDDDERVGRADKIQVDSAVLILQAISDREVRTGVWAASPFDIQGLKNAVVAAERIIPLLDYRKLTSAYNAFVSFAKQI